MQCGPTVINTGGGESLQIPKTTAHSYPNANLGTDPASAAQAGNIPTSDPAFSMVTLSAYKFGVLLQVARELIDDTAVDLLGYLAMQAGRAIGNDFGYQLVNGLGTGAERPAQPGLPRRYWRDHRRVRCTVICQPGRYGIQRYRPLPSVTKLLLVGSGQDHRRLPQDHRHGRQADLGAVRGSRLTGPAARQAARRRPVHAAGRHRGEDDLLGDFSQFFVRLVGGVRFERSDDFAFGSDLVTFRAILRGDGTLVDQTGAIRYYIGAST